VKWYKLKIHSAKLRELWAQSALVLLLTLACMAPALGTSIPYNQVFPNPMDDVCKIRKGKEICERHMYPTNGVHNEKGCNKPGSGCDYSHQTGRPKPEPEFPKCWTGEEVWQKIKAKLRDNPHPPWCCLFATNCKDGKKSVSQIPAKSAKAR
jgi:hypothetical protein